MRHHPKAAQLFANPKVIVSTENRWRCLDENISFRWRHGLYLNIEQPLAFMTAWILSFFPSIQPSTAHYCFSSALFNLVFFSLGVSDGSRLALLHENPVSFSRFLTFLLFLLVYHFCCCTFWDTLTCMFPLYNPPISFGLAPHFNHSWLRTTNIFCHSELNYLLERVL